MNKKEFYYPSIDGKTKIHAIRWEPEGEPKAILQIIHGMMEYIDRYDDFARYLTEEGYLVVGEDHLGHGESVQSGEHYGYFGEDGNAWVIADIHQLRIMMTEEFPELPYLMLGHSWGSFLLRQYITEKNARYAKDLAGAIVMGTAWHQKLIAEIGKIIAKILGTGKAGKPAKLIHAIGFRNNLKKIPNPRTGMDWLTRDSAEVDKHRADPLCTFYFSPNAYYHLFSGLQKANDVNRMRNLPEGLPILFASGAEDPVGQWGEGVRKAFMAYKDNTPCDVNIKIYEDDRHEILKELDKEQVFEDMREFLDYCLEKNGERLKPSGE